ncbi:hypothetical protein T4A_13810 [Trichinella pseudospiralis]|uniref:Uncharacterized protein n=1 Tax=Trichinella pseudospiralis TaxID=6337 RepID=A0A0V1EFY2_TRIPS|nr:hypothetical protein T4A_13810 [Trichinella pseudospiralis]
MKRKNSRTILIQNKFREEHQVQTKNPVGDKDKLESFSLATANISISANNRTH